jgi:anti-sigma-K factor RskA
MATHEPFDELAAVYALGALSGPELEEFLAHLRAGCAVCARALAEHEDTLARAAAGLAAPPPAAVRRALLDRLDAPAAPPRPRRPAWLRAATGMALAAGLAALGVGAALRARQASELGRLEGEMQALRAEVAAERRLRALLEDPATRFVALRGLEPSPGAEARVVWHPERGGLLVATDLPPPPRGKAYELWAIAGGTPRPAGVFSVDARGVGRMTLAPLAGAPPVEVFAVTLEPEGGVPAPTGPMFLASS